MRIQKIDELQIGRAFKLPFYSKVLEVEKHYTSTYFLIYESPDLFTLYKDYQLVLYHMGNHISDNDTFLRKFDDDFIYLREMK